MPRLIQSGKIEEIIYARLEPGEDLLEALWEICVEKDIKTGVILEGSGALACFRFQRFPRNPNTCVSPIDIVTLDGPLETNVQGIIGTTVVAEDMGTLPVPMIANEIETERDKWNMAGVQNGPGTPYIHAHMTATNKDITVCGHLMPGTKIENVGNSENVPSHFTVVIARISGLEFQFKIDGSGFYHHIDKLEH